MGYDVAEHGTVWALDFDEQYPGLTVRVRRPGFSAARLLARAERVLADSSADPARRLDAMADIFTALADSMDSWTLTRNGKPVPTTRAAVLACDGTMLGRIAGAWKANVIAPQAGAQRQDESALVGPPRFDDRLLRNLPMEALGDDAEDEADVEAPEEAAGPVEETVVESVADGVAMHEGPALTAVG